MCTSGEPLHLNVRSDWKDTDPTSQMCSLDGPLFSESIDCESGDGVLSRFSHPQTSHRNFASGQIDFHWRGSLFKLRYLPHDRVVHAARSACTVVQKAILDLRDALHAAAQAGTIPNRDAGIKLGNLLNHSILHVIQSLELNIEERRWVQMVDPLTTAVVYDGRHRLPAIMASLLFRAASRIAMTVALQLSEATLRIADDEHLHLQQAVYFAQITSGFFACGRGARQDDARHLTCSSEGFLRGRGTTFLYHGTTGYRWLHMAQLLRRSRSQRILEVGVFEGAVAHWILDRDESFHYVGVDPWYNVDDRYNAVLERLSPHIASGRGRLIRSTLQDVMGSDVDAVDVVWIDGDHSYEAIVSDIENAPRFLRPDGIVAGHDFNPFYLDVMKAVIDKARSTGVDVHLGMDCVWWFGERIERGHMFDRSIEDLEELRILDVSERQGPWIL